MQVTEEQALRERTAALVVDWARDRSPPFSGADRGEFGDVIEAAHIVSDEARLALHRWIDAGRRAGLSWTEIGATLGISKQAAQQRFRNAAEPDDGEPGDAEFVVRLGANAFNEMRMLREEGSKGNELVGTGGLLLRFRRTDRRWRYERVVAVRPPIDSMARDGWTYVSTWFPFHYFKRAET